MVECWVTAAERVDLCYRMHHRSVVLTPKMPPNLGKRGVGHLLSQVHGNLAGHHDCTSAAVLSQLFDRQVEQMSYGLLDRLDCVLTYL
jgi:hypothetical protein